MSSTYNGKQHTLPAHPQHSCGQHGKLIKEEIEDHWAKQSNVPTRLWGTVKPTKYGGEERMDSQPEQWLKGDYWNCDSNIRIWGEHEVKRNAAGQNHDVHRHDMIKRMVLPPQPGTGQKPRQCVSGVVSPDCCFLEAWGFDLGLRDRQAVPTKLWKPVNSGEMFRSLRSYDRNIPRMAENYKTMRRSRSEPGQTMPVNTVMTLRPEDVGGEAGEIIETDQHYQPEHLGRTHGSRSCRGWEKHDHTSKREAAKMSCGIHTQAKKSHPEGYPLKDHLELNPAAVYSKRFQVGGEENLRKRLPGSTVLSFNTKGTKRSPSSTMRSTASATMRSAN